MPGEASTLTGVDPRYTRSLPLVATGSPMAAESAPSRLDIRDRTLASSEKPPRPLQDLGIFI
eukprot:scaffold164848_cov48-Prasinocladus_malaysianus.AAC.2